MDELIPLFGLSGVETDIDLSHIQTPEELRIKLKTDLSRLQKAYESGNFLAKDRSTIMDKIRKISKYLRSDIIDNEWVFPTKEDVINTSKNVYERSLFLNLKNKLGLLDEQTYSSMINGLIKEVDDIKESFKNTIEKIGKLGEE